MDNKIVVYVGGGCVRAVFSNIKATLTVVDEDVLKDQDGLSSEEVDEKLIKETEGLEEVC